MAAYTWPTSLPQTPLLGSFAESLNINSIRTPMDNGPAKTRRRSRLPTPIQCAFTMTGAQIVTLEDFVKNTLFGVRRFNFTHPRLRTTCEVKIVPGSDGKYYDLSPLGAGMWHVAMAMEILP
jgi:hypothetical protein